MTTQTTFQPETHEATIQQRSMEAGERFRELYFTNTHPDNVNEALDLYIKLRRELPLDEITGRHHGAAEAHPTTQPTAEMSFTPFTF